MTPPEEHEAPPAPGPDTTAAGTTMLYLWVGIVLTLVAVPGLVGAARARRRYVRKDRPS